jgi:hypothetical protein
MVNSQGKADEQQRQQRHAKASAQLFDLRDKLADGTFLAGAIVMMRQLMYDIDGGSENGEQHNHAENHRDHMSAPVHHPFPPFQDTLYSQSGLFGLTLSAQSIEHRFSGIPLETMVFLKVRSYGLQFFTIHMNENSAGFTFHVKVIHTLTTALANILIAGAFAYVEHVFSDYALLHQPIQIPIDRCRTYTDALFIQICLGLDSSKMP